MEQTELYQEFERVIVDPEHHQRLQEEEREEERRVSSADVEAQPGVVRPTAVSYVRRVLNLIRKPHEQWDREDYALAARVVEDARFQQAAMEHEPRPREQAPQKRRFIRDEFERRLWGLPPRPHLS
jgi:hypothetical protein